MHCIVENIASFSKTILLIVMVTGLDDSYFFFTIYIYIEYYSIM